MSKESTDAFVKFLNQPKPSAFHGDFLDVWEAGSKWKQDQIKARLIQLMDENKMDFAEGCRRCINVIEELE